MAKLQAVPSTSAVSETRSIKFSSVDADSSDSDVLQLQLPRQQCPTSQPDPQTQDSTSCGDPCFRLFNEPALSQKRRLTSSAVFHVADVVTDVLLIAQWMQSGDDQEFVFACVILLFILVARVGSALLNLLKLGCKGFIVALFDLLNFYFAYQVWQTDEYNFRLDQQYYNNRVCDAVESLPASVLQFYLLINGSLKNEQTEWLQLISLFFGIGSISVAIQSFAVHLDKRVQKNREWEWINKQTLISLQMHVLIVSDFIARVGIVSAYVWLFWFEKRNVFTLGVVLGFLWFVSSLFLFVTVGILGGNSVLPSLIIAMFAGIGCMFTLGGLCVHSIFHPNYSVKNYKSSRIKYMKFYIRIAINAFALLTWRYMLGKNTSTTVLVWTIIFSVCISLSLFVVLLRRYLLPLEKKMLTKNFGPKLDRDASVGIEGCCLEFRRMPAPPTEASSENADSSDDYDEEDSLYHSSDE